MYVCLTFRFPIFIAVAVGEKLIEAIILMTCMNTMNVYNRQEPLT